MKIPEHKVVFVQSLKNQAYYIVSLLFCSQHLEHKTQSNLTVAFPLGGLYWVLYVGRAVAKRIPSVNSVQTASKIQSWFSKIPTLQVDNSAYTLG